MKFSATFAILALTLITKSNCQCFSKNDGKDPSSADSDLSEVSDFSLDLFRQLFPYNSTRNLFFSPYSIWNALALVYLGSEGNTEQQLEKVLRVGSKVSLLKKTRALDYLYKIRQITSGSTTFGVVNKAYFDEGLTLKSCAKQILDKDLETINFGKPEIAANTINNVVSNVTKGRITNVVSASSLEDAQMAIVNAAYFRDNWQKPFKNSFTKHDIFYGFDGEHFVEFMRQKGIFRHGVSENLGVHVLEIPYTLKAISFYILLPPYILGEEGLNSLVERLTKEELDLALRYTSAGEVKLTLPKFTMETTLEEPLMEALKSMGIRDLFDPVLSNLKNFIPSGGVSVSSTLHKSFLKISEEGTEAAAASVVIGTGRSARPLEIQEFECNHPFVFTIFDKLTRNILFIGTYKTPV